MDKLTGDLILLVLYSLPGFITGGCRSAINNRTANLDELHRKLDFLMWSLVSWVLLLWLSKLTVAYYGWAGCHIAPLVLAVDRLPKNWNWWYAGVVPVSAALGFFLGHVDNVKYVEKRLKNIRALYGSLPESRDTVWTGTFSRTLESPLVRVYSVGNPVDVIEGVGTGGRFSRRAELFDAKAYDGVGERVCVAI